MQPDLSSSRSARDLADMVRAELRWVECLDPSRIAVSEHHAHIALAGSVGSWSEREAAVRAARRVPGVRTIDAGALRIRVGKSGRPRDLDLARAAQDALRWHLAVPTGAVHASAHAGTVTLEGTVARACEREAAEAAVRALEAVVAIDDRIRIRGPSREEMP
jgi:osmotically-inducible protein OsmY